MEFCNGMGERNGRAISIRPRIRSLSKDWPATNGNMITRDATYMIIRDAAPQVLFLISFRLTPVFFNKSEFLDEL